MRNEMLHAALISWRRWAPGNDPRKINDQIKGGINGDPMDGAHSASDAAARRAPHLARNSRKRQAC
jgi:hypothetical protein